MKILITGDFVVTDNFRNHNLLDQEIQDYFNESNYNIINLEAPIGDFSEKQKLLKTGPHLRVSEDVIIPQLRLLKADLLTLANNHILDYGTKALQNTFKILDQYSFEYVGAGNNSEHAKSIKTVNTNDLSIALINFCENEWSTTFNTVPGTNPLDIVENSRDIMNSKKTHDKVICIFHGGHQLYAYPSPKMQQMLRFFVEQGADAVICHHTHKIGGFEIYNGAPIVYGLGNFLFTLPYKFEGFHEGIIAELIINKHEPVKFIPKFIQQNVKSHYLNFSKGTELTKLEEKFAVISTQLLNANSLQLKWEEFIELKKKSYLNKLSAYSLIRNKYLHFVLSKMGISLMNERKAKILLNHLRCESHNEVSIEVLKKYLKKDDE